MDPIYDLIVIGFILLVVAINLFVSREGAQFNSPQTRPYRGTSFYGFYEMVVKWISPPAIARAIFKK